MPHLPEIVADMVRSQRLTGMRPAEVCFMRPCDKALTHPKLGSVKQSELSGKKLASFGIGKASVRLPWPVTASC